MTDKSTISALLHATITELSSPIEEYRIFSERGKLALTQLSQLRHRGAFSTVSLTFAACRQSCSQHQDPSIRGLPQEWYQVALGYMAESASVLTRRSAGLPAIISGILCASLGGELFDEVMLDLQAIADGPVELDEETGKVRLPQVHALNCLKDIFTNSRFSEHCEEYVADSLEIAAACLNSQM